MDKTFLPGATEGRLRFRHAIRRGLRGEGKKGMPKSDRASSGGGQGRTSRRPIAASFAAAVFALAVPSPFLPSAAESSAAVAGEAEAFGGIEGTIKPAVRVKRVLALDRSQKQEPVATQVRIREIEAAFDAATGRYTIGKLAPGTYDLYIETKEGWKIEGVDFRPAEEGAGRLAPEDAAELRDRALRMKTYEDEKRCLRVGGDSENAVLLMELIRRGKTSLRDRTPFVTWRVELWFYEKRYGAWTRKEPSRVLRRFRPPVEEFEKWVYLWEPALGGVKVASGATAKRDFEIPEKPEPFMGRYPGVKDPPAEKARDDESGETGKRKRPAEEIVAPEVPPEGK